MHFDFWPSRLPKTQAWRAQEPVFWPVLRWSSMSNAAAGTDKKETIFAASGLTSGLISHLDLALRRTSTSDHLGFPKRSLQDSETAWPGELKEPIFWPVLGWSSMSHIAAGTDGLASSKARFLTCAGGSSMSNVAIKFSHTGPSQGALPLADRGRRIRKRNFYKEKKYNSNRRLLFREEHPILKRDFY